MPQDPTTGSSKRFRAVVIALSVFSAIAAIAAAAAIVHWGSVAYRRGWNGVKGADGYTVRLDRDVQGIDQLRNGDRIVAVDGDRNVDRAMAVGYYYERERYTLTVLREGHELTFALHWRQYPVDRAWLDSDWSTWSVGVAFCLVATLIGFLRGNETAARMAWAAGLSTGLLGLRASVPQMGLAAPLWKTLFPALIFPFSPMHYGMAFDFFRRFPREATGRLWRWIGFALYSTTGVIAASAVALGVVVPALGPDYSYSALPIIFAVGPVEGLFQHVIEALAGLAIVSVAVRNYVTVAALSDRRRLRWILWGAVGALGPLIAFETLQAVERVTPAVRPWIGPAGFWISRLSNVAVVLIPLTFGYAIIKHELFDIRFVVRRGLQYLLAKNALRALLVVPAAAFAYGLVVHRDIPLGQLLLAYRLYAYLLAAAALGLAVRAPLMRHLDRRFFREAYDRERLLIELIDRVERAESVSGVSRLVSQDLEAAFHPKSLFAWYRDGDRPRLTLSYSSGGHLQTVEIGDQSPLARYAARLDGPADVESVESSADAALPAGDRAWLAGAGVRLVVPIVSSGARLAGLLMLGEKKSEEPYSATDRQLLRAIAKQIAIACENSELKDRADRDRRIRHDVLAKIEGGGVNLLRECPSCGACYDATEQRCAADGAELTLTVPVERTLDGKYRLDRLLGRGGMGAVYEAADLRLARTVAVKIMHGRAFGDRRALARFEREARSCAQLDHPNVVTIFDFGSAGAEGAFIVMEAVKGRTLRRELRARGRCPATIAAAWLEQICAGVAAAHARHIVHRDLKPENVIVSTRADGAPIVKVMDFGLAKLLTAQSDAADRTEPGAVIGTIGYMPPEQLTGREVDARADVFALGVIAFEAVAGARPFAGDDAHALMQSIAAGPRSLPGEGPEWRRLDDVIRRALAADRADRYASVEAFAAEMLPALRGIPTRVDDSAISTNQV